MHENVSTIKSVYSESTGSYALPYWEKSKSDKTSLCGCIQNYNFSKSSKYLYFLEEFALG